MKYNKLDKVLRNAKTKSLDDIKRSNAIAYEKMCIKETLYNNAKDSGKLWSAKKKAESKAAKKLARKEKRLANKSA